MALRPHVGYEDLLKVTSTMLFCFLSFYLFILPFIYDASQPTSPENHTVHPPFRILLTLIPLRSLSHHRVRASHPKRDIPGAYFLYAGNVAVESRPAINIDQVLVLVLVPVPAHH